MVGAAAAWHPCPCGQATKRPFCARLEGQAHRRPWRQPDVTVPTSFRRLAGVVLGAASLLLPATLSAQGTAQNPSYVPSAHELAKLTASGSYLAARHAGTERDAGAAAAYYRAALRNDPKNTELLERAFLSVLAEGDVEEAVRLADQVVKLDKTDRIARLVHRRACAEAEEICRRQSRTSRNRCAGRSPTWQRPCSAPGRAMARATPRAPSSRSTSCRAPTGMPCSRTCTRA